jgi:hypothetical protein
MHNNRIRVEVRIENVRFHGSLGEVCRLTRISAAEWAEGERPIQKKKSLTPAAEVPGHGAIRATTRGNGCYGPG